MLDNWVLLFLSPNSDSVGLGHQNPVLTPTQLSGLKEIRITQLCCSDDHCMVRTAGGEVFAWGNNTSGQLGNGTTTSCSTPQLIKGFASAVDWVCCGSNFSVAINDRRTVFCW